MDTKNNSPPMCGWYHFIGEPYDVKVVRLFFVLLTMTYRQAIRIMNVQTIV